MYDVEYGRGEVIINDKPIQYWDVRSYRRHWDGIASMSPKLALLKLLRLDKTPYSKLDIPFRGADLCFSF